MWIDERGSEVLDVPECRRLLALGVKQHLHGHIGIPAGEEAPTVLPLNYAIWDLDLVVVVGEGLFHRLANRLVAFQVDGSDTPQGTFGGGDTRLWSVLVRGLATEERGTQADRLPPATQVTEPGQRVVRIRTDVMTGRKLGYREAPAHDAPADETAPVYPHLVRP